MAVFVPSDLCAPSSSSSSPSRSLPLTEANVQQLSKCHNIFEELFPDRVRLNDDVSSYSSHHGTLHGADHEADLRTQHLERQRQQNAINDTGSNYSRPIRSPTPPINIGIFRDPEDEELAGLDDAYDSELEHIFDDVDDECVSEDHFLLSPPPPSTTNADTETPTSIYHRNYNGKDDFCVVQWNVRGLETATKTLWNDIVHGNISVLLIQEQAVHYNADWTPIYIEGYHRYTDANHKSAIYVRDGIKHRRIPLKLHSNGDSPKDILHATAVATRIKVNNQWQYLLLISVYKSPNGHADVEQLRSYIEQGRTYIRDTLGSKAVNGFILGGDLNATHSLILPADRQHQTWSPNSDGQKIADLCLTKGYDILNNGQPTRFYADNNTRSIKTSWLDWTICDGIVKDLCEWRVRETDTISDHYQIWMRLRVGYHKKSDDYVPAQHWKLNNTPESWQCFGRVIQKLWDTERHEVDKLDASTIPVTDKAEKLGDIIVELFNTAGNNVFGLSDPSDRRWRRWMTKAGQKICLDYTDCYHQMTNGEHHNSQQWHYYINLRDQRNYVMRSLKKNYLEKEYARAKYHGDHPWKATNRLRGAISDQSQSLPDIIKEVEPPTDGSPKPAPIVLATTNVERVDIYNKWLHREEVEHTGPSSWCWKSIPTTRYSYDTQPRQFDRTNHLPPPSYNEPKLGIPKDISDDYLEEDLDRCEDLFSYWIKERTARRWRHAESKHEQEWRALNRPISKREIRRVISGLKNGKSTGPDMIKPEFIKKIGGIITPILERTLNLFFVEWQCFPRVFKERWVSPLMKPGRDCSLMRNLRPVSLTSYIGKIYEKVMVYRLGRYLMELNLLSSIHYAYIQGRSSIDCLQYVIDQIETNQNHNIDTHAALYDLTSAYDTVRHKVLLWKLEHEYFISGIFLQTLKSFLHGRRTAVKIGGTISDWIDDKDGVPQGGALSPLLYLIYIDNAATINRVPNVRVAIYSDDIFALTGKIKTFQSRSRTLRFVTIFLAWYCFHHGLRINYIKTKYKQLYRGQTPNDPPINLTHCGALQQRFTRDDEKSADADMMVSDTPFKISTTSYKYLGIHFDAQLNLKAHVAYIYKQVNMAFGVIRRELKHLWHVTADTIYNIYDTCVFALYKYSAFLWPKFSKASKDKLTRQYRKIYRTIFACPKDTGHAYMFLQTGTYDLPVLMEQEVSIRMTRLLRTPANSALSQLFRDRYWTKINSSEDDDTDDDFLPSEYHQRTSCVDDTKGTLITKTINSAYQHDNDDLIAHSKHPIDYKDLPKLTSSYVDLTDEKYDFPLDDTPFTDNPQPDDDYILDDQPTPNAIYLFTDGACGDWNKQRKMLNGRFGGYGSYRVSRNEYQKLINWKNSGGQITAAMLFHCKYARRMHNYLSARCSIDFCEAMAIKEGLQQTILDLREIAQDPTSAASPYTTTTNHHNNLLRNDDINELHIISDSKVVIEWIRGRYRIRNPRMQGLIDDILHHMDTLSKENDSLLIFTRWTKAHVGTIGNEQADGCAALGLLHILKLKEKDRVPPDLWRWYNLRASCNYNKRWFKNDQEENLASLIESSRFGRLYKEEFDRNMDRYPNNVPDEERVGYRWSKRWLQECSDLSRIDIRALLMIRTGHDRLARYTFHAHNKGTTPLCPCGTGEQDFTHLLRDCTLPHVKFLRRNIQDRAQAIFAQNLNTQAPDALQFSMTQDYHVDYNQPITELPPRTYFSGTECYIYPDGRLPRHHRAELQRMGCHLYRILRRKPRKKCTQQSQHQPPPPSTHCIMHQSLRARAVGRSR